MKNDTQDITNIVHELVDKSVLSSDISYQTDVLNIEEESKNLVTKSVSSLHGNDSCCVPTVPTVHENSSQERQSSNSPQIFIKIQTDGQDERTRNGKNYFINESIPNERSVMPHILNAEDNNYVIEDPKTQSDGKESRIKASISNAPNSCHSGK